MITYSKIEPALVEQTNSIKGICRIRWDIKSFSDSVSSFYSYQEEVLNYKPTLLEIRNIICDYYNGIASQKILGDYTWQGHKVWLSAENQADYTAIYLRVKTGENIFPIKLKFGNVDAPEYYDFAGVSEYAAFYNALQDHIQNCLQNCWKEKDDIDYTLYEQLLKNI